VSPVCVLKYIFDPGMFKNIYWYEILIEAGGTTLTHHRGVVAEAPSTKNFDFAGGWENFIDYADKIPEILKKDINAPK